MKKSVETIRNYLDSHKLDYLKLTIREKLVRDRIPVQFASRLLHAPSCSVTDQYIGKSAVCYGVMDYLIWMEVCCEGFYYALAGIPSAKDIGSFKYHMTSHTFGHDAFSKYEWSHFAIRKSNNEYHHLVTLDEEDGTRPGCLRLCGYDRPADKITEITSKQQAPA